MTEQYLHRTVLLSEAVDALQIIPDGIYFDATFGRGGHSRAILEKLSPNGKLFCFDKDPEALAVAQQFAAADSRVHVIHGSFTNILATAEEQNLIGKVNGILFDLGISSPQVDDPTRGFSFKNSGPLDMRMDPTQGQSAAEWLAYASDRDIANVLFRYGEEKLSRRIARRICEVRSESPITTTAALAELIAECYPKRKGLQPRIHPATRSFQAIRIYINNELEDVQEALRSAVQILAPEGRLVVISFHSLEDRIVKRFFRDEERGPELPRDIPITEAMRQNTLKRIGGMMVPSDAEIAENPRARSAKCRVAEKIRK